MSERVQFTIRVLGLNAGLTIVLLALGALGAAGGHLLAVLMGWHGIAWLLWALGAAAGVMVGALVVFLLDIAIRGDIAAGRRE